MPNYADFQDAEPLPSVGEPGVSEPFQRSSGPSVAEIPGQSVHHIVYVSSTGLRSGPPNQRSQRLANATNAANATADGMYPPVAFRAHSDPTSSRSSTITTTPSNGSDPTFSRSRARSSTDDARDRPWEQRARMADSADDLNTLRGLSEAFATPSDWNSARPNLRLLLHSARLMPDEEVNELVPKDPFGLPTSVGSKLHTENGKRCKPCVFYVPGDPDSCERGSRCRFCHFPHGKALVSHASALETQL